MCYRAERSVAAERPDKPNIRKDLKSFADAPLMKCRRNVENRPVIFQGLPQTQQANRCVYEEAGIFTFYRHDVG